MYISTVQDNRLFYAIVEIYGCICGSHAITSWGVDRVLNKSYRNGIMLCLLCGGLTRTLGRIFANFFGFMKQRESLTDTIHNAYLSLFTAFSLALSYYVLREVVGLQPENARAIIAGVEIINLSLVSWSKQWNLFRITSNGLAIVLSCFGMAGVLDPLFKKNTV